MSDNSDSKNLRIAIIVGRFNEEISNRLLDSALKRLEMLGFIEENIHVVWVPGAFEIPFTCQQVINKMEIDAVVTLGAVVRGGTPHFDYVAGGCARGVQEVSLTTSTPISFGVLTTDTYEQALERSDATYVDHDGSTGDKGSSAVDAAVWMAQLVRSLGSQ